MSRIEMIEPDKAKGKMEEVYGKFKGKLANILKVHSLHPDSLEAHWNYYRIIMMGPSPLPRQTREMIAVIVSKTNNCQY